jgi:hypothetical protein
MSPPRKDLVAARALARAAQTGESLAVVAKAEGVSVRKIYEERARLASLPKQSPVALAPLPPVTLAAPSAETSAFETLSAVPPDAALEESLQLAARVKARAEALGEARTALIAQQHIDRLRGIGQPTSEGVPKAEVSALLRAGADAIAPWPEALAAYKAVIRASTT